MKIALRINLYLILIVFSTSSVVLAKSVPQIMNYQGQLTDVDGEPLATGEYKLTFKLWNNVAEDELGTEVHDSVPVVRGQFNVILGGTTSLEGNFEGAERFISIAIGDATDISPRQKILSAPYALRAQHAETADVARSLEQGTSNFETEEYLVNFSHSSVTELTLTALN